MIVKTSNLETYTQKAKRGEGYLYLEGYKNWWTYYPKGNEPIIRNARSQEEKEKVGE